MPVRLLPVFILLLLSVNITAVSAETRVYDLCGIAGQPQERYVVSSSSPVDHVPRDDVSHNASQYITIPDPVDIPLTVNVAGRLGIDIPQGTQMEAPIGFISIYKDGRILYDGKDLTQDIASICARDADAFDDMIDRLDNEQ